MVSQDQIDVLVDLLVAKRVFTQQEYQAATDTAIERLTAAPPAERTGIEQTSDSQK